MSLVEAFHSNIEMRLVGFVMLPLGVKCRVVLGVIQMSLVEFVVLRPVGFVILR